MQVDSTFEQEKEEIRNKVSKPLIWIGILSIIMLLAGLTSAYIVRQAEGNWFYFELPSQFYVSTAIIVLSSITLFWAQWSIKKDQQKFVQYGLLATLLLGIAFVFSQFESWNALVASNIFFAGNNANASGSYLYVISGVHLAHLGFGVLALLFTWIKSLLGKYSSANRLGIEICAIYWHFLTFLWIYLLLFLLYIR